jgi:hypothetical protein
MALADVCQASGLVQDTAIIGQAIGSVDTDAVLMELALPVEDI